MTTLSLVTVSPDRRVRFEQSAGGSVVCLDFQSMAGLIDTVAGADPRRLQTLLAVTWEGGYRMEMRAVLRAAVACRDPLADLGSICRDALRTLNDLEKLARARHWESLPRILGRADSRACALLNACDHEIARRTGPKQARFEVIRARLEEAARHERKVRGQEMRSSRSCARRAVPTSGSSTRHGATRNSDHALYPAHPGRRDALWIVGFRSGVRSQGAGQGLQRQDFPGRVVT